MSHPAPRGALWALLAGNFVIGTGVMVVPGTLNEISTSLAVTVATAGQLITVAAVVMCLGAPLLAAVVAGWDRRQLLALTLVWYAMGHIVSALMPSFGALLPVRMLTVVAPAIFTPQAAACAGMLVPPEQRAERQAQHRGHRPAEKDEGHGAAGSRTVCAVQLFRSDPEAEF